MIFPFPPARAEGCRWGIRTRISNGKGRPAFSISALYCLRISTTLAQRGLRAATLVPELVRLGLHLLPLGIRDGRQLHLAAGDTVVRLAPPVPVLPIIMRTVAGQAEKDLQMLGERVPLFAVGKIAADPAAIDVVGQVILADVGPAGGIVLRDP